MPFETKCQGCGRQLRVGDEHAGKKARCPHCGAIFDVPTDVALGSLPTDGTAAEFSSPPSPTSQPLWNLKVDDGTVYGPVTRSELDRWASEGRVTPSSLVSESDHERWQPATSVFPWLAQGQGNVSRENPFAEKSSSLSDGGSINPYVSPVSGSLSGVNRGLPHRGGLILTLGILALVCGCAVIGPVAWIMGNNDLKQMQAGRMDPSGQGITQAGMILGIISTVFMVLGCGFYALVAIVSVAANN